MPKSKKKEDDRLKQPIIILLVRRDVEQPNISQRRPRNLAINAGTDLAFPLRPKGDGPRPLPEHAMSDTEIYVSPSASSEG